MKTAVAQKEVTVLARAQFKNNPKAVIYKVLSSNGKDEYYTTIYNGKAASCTCPATKPCYHMTQLQARENERTQDELRFSPWHGSNRDGEPLSREAYVAEFDPCTVPGMY